jgi:hypothetical protein
MISAKIEMRQPALWLLVVNARFSGHAFRQNRNRFLGGIVVCWRMIFIGRTKRGRSW